MSFENVHVLVVDDFELGRDYLRTALIGIGFSDEQIEEAEDGAKAFAMLEKATANKTPFQLVFSDWNMPVMTGLEFLKKCRATPAYAKLTFIMVTSEAESSSVMEAVHAGATDYLVKPVSGEQLIEKLEQRLK